MNIYRLKEISWMLKIKADALRTILTNLKILRRPLPLFTDKDVETIKNSKEYADTLKRMSIKTKRKKRGVKHE